MLAYTYIEHGKFELQEKARPEIKDSRDAIVRVTLGSICTSDLHIKHGSVPRAVPGITVGHEMVGVVEQVGADVTSVKPGDRVTVNVETFCGECFFCEQELMAACENTNTGRGAILNKKQIPPGAALFGFSHLYGGIPGGQAEYVRIPKGNVGPFKVPGSLPDEKVLFLTDILPTAWQAVNNAQVGRGSSVAIYGAGPVGLLAAACARMLGAEQIFMVDHHPYRLRFAHQTYGVIPVNFDEVDAAEFIIQNTTGYRGVDAVIDAVGFEAKGSMLETVMTNLKLEGSSGSALRQCIAAVRRGGVVSVPGVYAGPIHGFLFGDAFDKGLTFKMGQTHVHNYLPQLLEHIENGDLSPDLIITHRMKLEDAAEGYRIFDKKEEDCRKVILTP